MVNNKFNEIEAIREDREVFFKTRTSLKSKRSNVFNNRKDIEKIASQSNNVMNKSFKFITGIFLFTIIAFVLYFLITVIIDGTSPVVSNDDISLDYILFGGIYNPDGHLYAVGFMFVNTLYTSILALLIATPFSVATALAITRMAPKSVAKALSFGIIGLAAVPSVIYGLFVGEAVNGAIATLFGSSYSSGTVLSVIITLALMITPTITLITITTINNIDKSIEDGAYALGATRTQANLKITLKAALPGIFAGMALGIGRALGEATAVTLAASPVNQGVNLGWLDPAANLTQWMLLGFGELDPTSIEYEMRFTMALILIVAIVLVMTSIKLVERKSIKGASIKFKKQKKALKYLKENKNKYLEKSLKYWEVLKYKYYKLRYQKQVISEEVIVTEDNEELIKSTSEFALNYAVETKKSVLSKYSDDLEDTIEDVRHRSNIISGVIYFMSAIIVSMLVAIISFLIATGASELSWHLLTSPYNNEQINILVQNNSESFDEPNSVSENDSKYWVEEWGFALYYHEEENGSTDILITDINSNSPLTESMVYISTIQNTFEEESVNLNSYYELHITGFYNTDGNITNPNGNSNWDDERYVNTLIDWINMQSELSIQTESINGGIHASFVNTIILILITIAISVPVGILAAIYISEYIKSPKIKEQIKSILVIFSGLPTLIIGLLASVIFLSFMPPEIRLVAAAIGMAFITLPTIMMQILNAINDVPEDRVNASLALGASQSSTFFKVKFPSILPAVVTTSILAMGRVLGETAALIMFFLLNPADQASLSGGATLATHIYYILVQAEESDPATAASISIVIIAFIGLIFMTSQKAENRKWAEFSMWSIATVFMILGVVVINLPLFWIGLSAVFILILYDALNTIINYKFKKRIPELFKTKFIGVKDE